MDKTLKIDVISDVVCPWCAVGLSSLELALARIGDEAQVALTLHPYELNPDMPAGGVVHLDYITRKYDMAPEQARVNREQIRERAAAVGFTMNRDDNSRVYNTFDAHRLLAWAGELDQASQSGTQLALKRALLKAYFTDGQDVGSREVLQELAAQAGLDRAQAGAVLASDRFAQQVKEEEALWASRGIRSVPAVVVNDRYLISGGQPPEVFEQQLRSILAGETA